MKKHLRLLFQTLKMTTIGIVVVTIIFALNQVNISRFFPIRTVRVYGANRVDHEDVKLRLMPLVNNGFFAVNVEYIRDRLTQLPWVQTLSVRRVWPDQVELSVVEKKPVAHWNAESLLSDAGELFTPGDNAFTTTLPQFIGPDGQQLFVYRNFKDFNRILSPLHAKISTLELTPYFTWKITLNNGIAMQIGHKDILTRLSHFVRVYPKIVGSREGEIDYIDLRYPNGVAVRWKESKEASLGNGHVTL